jgi:hypothetical protein
MEIVGVPPPSLMGTFRTSRGDPTSRQSGMRSEADVRRPIWIFGPRNFGQLLPLLPPTPVSWRAAARAWRGAEFGAGLAGVGGLDHLARAAERFDGFCGLGAEGQGFRAVHFVEMGFVDFGGATTRGPPTPTSRASFARLGPRKEGGSRGARSVVAAALG